MCLAFSLPPPVTTTSPGSTSPSRSTSSLLSAYISPPAALPIARAIPPQWASFEFAEFTIASTFSFTNSPWTTLTIVLLIRMLCFSTWNLQWWSWAQQLFPILLIFISDPFSSKTCFWLSSSCSWASRALLLSSMFTTVHHWWNFGRARAFRNQKLP